MPRCRCWSGTSSCTGWSTSNSEHAMSDLAPIIVPVLSFAAVAAIVYVVGQHYALQARMQQRLPAQTGGTEVAGGIPPRGFDAFMARNFDARRFGIDAARREKLRGDLLKAGYFGSQSFNY